MLTQQSPFSFITDQLNAAELAKPLEPPIPVKRPRGRPVKPPEPPLAENARRYMISDKDPHDLHVKPPTRDKNSIRRAYQLQLATGASVQDAINSLMLTFKAQYKEIFDICVA